MKDGQKDREHKRLKEGIKRYGAISARTLITKEGSRTKILRRKEGQ